MRRGRLLCLGSSVSLLLACSANSTAPSSSSASTGGDTTASAGTGGATAVQSPPATATGGSFVSAGGTVSASGNQTGGAATVGAGGASGASTPPPVMTSMPAGYPYDPSVHFDWPETTPMGGKCRPGMYSGSFTCDVNLGLGTITFAGPVAFTLAQSSSGEFLEIANGTLRADDTSQAATGSGTLTGRLDCSTNALHANIRDGMYSVGIAAGSFLGTLDGHLDRLTETLTGTWSFVPVLGTLPAGGAPDAAVILKLPISCEGTWSVTRQP